MIGPITVVSEGSIGSNTRRIEAVTGAGVPGPAGARAAAPLDEAARLLKVEPDGVRRRPAEGARPPAPGREGAGSACSGARLARRRGPPGPAADNGVVVHRQDGVNPDQLRDLAQAVRAPRARAWWWWPGRPTASKVGVAVASGDEPSTPVPRSRSWPQLVGGGGGGSAELAVAGGSDPARIDDLLAEARRRLGA